MPSNKIKRIIYLTGEMAEGRQESRLSDGDATTSEKTIIYFYLNQILIYHHFAKNLQMTEMKIILVLIQGLERLH